MLKLYRTSNNVMEYWEAWEDTPTQVIVHWGIVGHRGDNRTVSHKVGIKSTAVIEKEARSAIAAGFKSIAPEEHAQVVIQFKMQGDGTRKDFNRIMKVEELMNETLGWTGLGHCDGTDLGSGSMNVFCEVVEGKIACPIIIAELKQHKFLEAATIACRVRTQSDDYDVAWPENFEGQFEL